MTFRLQHALIATVLTAVFICACQKTYYAAWEKLGKEKRHLLRDQVEKARNDQEKATEEFRDVLTRVKEIYGFDGGDLENFYNKLRDDYEACEDRAAIIDERIENVEQIASDLFEEWNNEINEISNPRYRSKSLQSLRETERRYARLNNAMSRARARMNPVLRQLRDYVLYLKHNLNARAVGALGQEVMDIENEVNLLIADINRSIRESENFLKTFE